MKKPANVKYKRRKWMVNPSIQLKIIGHSLLIGAISALSVHLSYLEERVSEIYVPGLGLMSPGHFVWLPLVALLMAFIWSHWFSNRIVGPIYAIERQIGEILHNKSNRPIRCREKDYFASLVNKLNQLLKKCGVIESA